MAVEAAVEAALTEMGLGTLDHADPAVQIVRKRIMRFAAKVNVTPGAILVRRPGHLGNFVAIDEAGCGCAAPTRPSTAVPRFFSAAIPPDQSPQVKH